MIFMEKIWIENLLIDRKALKNVWNFSLESDFREKE